MKAIALQALASSLAISHFCVDYKQVAFRSKSLLRDGVKLPTDGKREYEAEGELRLRRRQKLCLFGI